MTARVLFIINPKAGSAPSSDEILAAYGRQDGVAAQEATTPDEVAQCAREAATSGVELLVAAGGDGTINAVVNGLMGFEHQTRLGILPLGTGNDFCHTLAIPHEPVEAMRVLHAGRERRLDVFEIETPSQRRFFLNMGTAGNGAQVIRTLTPEVKRRWGPFCYFRTAIDVLSDLVPYEIQLRLNDGAVETYRAINILFANGRTSGGGIEMAPQANPEDGLMEVIIIREGPLVETAALAAQFLMSNYLESDQVVYHQARTAQLEARPDIPVSVDGDLVTTNEPVQLRVHPKALTVLVGLDYQPQLEVLST